MIRKFSIVLFLFGVPLQAFARTVGEIVQEARGAVQEINTIAIEVDSQLQQAQGSGDSILLQCVQTKQASISALQDISEMSLGNLQAAESVTKAEYELRKISLSLSKVRQFGNEASRCQGETASGGGNADGSGSGNSSSTSDVSVDESEVSSNISEGSSVEGENSYSFDSTSSSTGGDESMSNAEGASPGGSVEEVISEPNETSPY
jgi:hypothetical protein